MNRLIALLGVCCLVASALGDTVAVEYVKSLGQSSPLTTPVMTAGGSLAIDADGNLYAGTPGGSSYLQKFTPDGRVVWSGFHNIPGYQGLAVDDQFVYACGSGYYGYRQIFRYRTDSGRQADGWQLQWQKDEPANGVRAMGMPVALAVDDTHLFVVDQRGHELRRLNKATGEEAPFNKRIMVVDPRDLALLPDGRLLILTGESVLEVDGNGNPLRVPLIDGLSHAVAVTFDAPGNRLLIAEGGVAPALVNKVRAFDLDGKPLSFSLGRGGSFHGPWSPQAFAFSEGDGDIIVAASGGEGYWVNPGSGHKLQRVLRVLHHFTRDGEYTHSIMGVSTYANLAVDAARDVYLAGQLKLSWDNTVAWTSGLIHSGAGEAYPATHVHWPTYVALAGGRLYVHDQPGRFVFELDKTSGRCDKAPRDFYKVDQDAIITGSGDGLFLALAKSRKLYRLPLDLDAEPQPLADCSGSGDAPIVGFAVSRDASVAYLRAADTLAAMAVADGRAMWQTKAAGHVLLLGDMLVTGNPAAAGFVVIDPQSGQVMHQFADVPAAGITAIESRAPLAGVTTQDGEHHLFIDHNGAIVVYRLTRHAAAAAAPVNLHVESPPAPEDR